MFLLSSSLVISMDGAASNLSKIRIMLRLILKTIIQLFYLKQPRGSFLVLTVLNYLKVISTLPLGL